MSDPWNRNEHRSGGGSGEENGSATLLRAFVLRLEALGDERDAITGDMRGVRREAKLAGFDVPTINAVVKRRKLDPAQVIEADGLLETYEAAIGSGAAAAGILATTRNEDGTFEIRMVAGGEQADEKLSKAVKARRAAVAMAELARQARES